MAAKRKYMDTELPPQESEGKVVEAHSFGLWCLYMTHVYIMVYQPQEMSIWELRLNMMRIRHILVSLTCPSAVCSSDSFFLSFSSDLFQDLSQLQETWLTEGEICLQAAFPLNLYFSVMISPLMTVERLDDVSVWKDWWTQKDTTNTSYSFIFYSTLYTLLSIIHKNHKFCECSLLPGFLSVPQRHNKVLLMHFYWNAFIKLWLSWKKKMTSLV